MRRQGMKPGNSYERLSNSAWKRCSAATAAMFWTTLGKTVRCRYGLSGHRKRRSTSSIWLANIPSPPFFPSGTPLFSAPRKQAGSWACCTIHRTPCWPVATNTSCASACKRPVRRCRPSDASRCKSTLISFNTRCRIHASSSRLRCQRAGASCGPIRQPSLLRLSGACVSCWNGLKYVSGRMRRTRASSSNVSSPVPRLPWKAC